MKKVLSGLLLLFSFSVASAASNQLLTESLGVGSGGDQVTALQKFLKFQSPLGEQGYGYFGAYTLQLLRDFESKQGLPLTNDGEKMSAATMQRINDCSFASKDAESCPKLSALAAPKATTDTSGLGCPTDLDYLSDGFPTIYFNPASGDLIQINKPFDVIVTGSMTSESQLTASPGVEFIGPKKCNSGTFSPTTGCGGIGGFSFSQQAKVTGSPREITIRASAAGARPFKPGGRSMPNCRTAQVYRSPVNYKLGLSIDKNQFGSYEAFKVTISGMTRPELVSAFSNGSGYVNAPFAITREGAPASSCEYSLNMSICGSDSVMNCALIPGNDSSSPEYLCAATGIDTSSALRYPNKNGPVKYTLTIRNTNGLFDTYSPAPTGASDSITLLKHEINGVNGAETSYGSCPSGEGIDPRTPENGCTRCQNISNQYRKLIATCNATGQDAFTWTYERDATTWDNQAKSCEELNAIEGRACSNSSLFCKTGTRILACKNTSTTVNQATYHGKVLDGSTNPPTPLSGVTVQSWSVIGNMMAYASPCPATTTNANGEYRFSRTESQSLCLSSNGYVRFTKPGYVEESIPSGNEFDKLIRTYTMKPLGGGGTPVNPGAPANPNTLSLSPSTARLGHSVGSSVTFTLANGGTALGATPETTKLDVCYEITRREEDQFTPPGGIHKAASPSSCNWINSWTGNSDWDKVNGGKDLQWKLKYTAEAFDICKGVQIVVGFRHRDTGQITYSILEADGRPANDPCHGGTGGGGTQNTSGYYWHMTSEGVWSPAPPMCPGNPPSAVHGEPCTLPNYGCQAGGKEYKCLEGVPAPKAALVSTLPNSPTNSNSGSGTGIFQTIGNAVNSAVNSGLNVVGGIVNGISNGLFNGGDDYCLSGNCDPILDSFPVTVITNGISNGIGMLGDAWNAFSGLFSGNPNPSGNNSGTGAGGESGGGFNSYQDIGGNACFVSGTKVQMADGSEKDIAQLSYKDIVMTSGGPQKVVKIYHIPYKGKVYAFNGSGNYFVTPSHPFMTSGGWKSIDPKMSMRESKGLSVTQLRVGDSIIMHDGSATVITSIESSLFEGTVYNFDVKGTHDYYADGYWVHNVATVFAEEDEGPESLRLQEERIFNSKK